MEDIWSILELEPTRDPAAIRRAYARLAPKYHPEDDPDGFLRLREAYQRALAWAEGDGGSSAPQPQEQEDSGWRLASDAEGGPNPYADHEAAQKFRALYSGGQRRNAKAWMDYFTSSPFLEAAKEESFTALLLSDVEAHTGLQPSREFLTWLSIAYQLTGEDDSNGGRRFRLAQGAAFEGLDNICRIAAMGPSPRRLQGNELAMFISFFEYNHLSALAASGGWNDRAVSEASNIVRRYTTSYLQDKCSKREWNDVERHPAGLRLLEHFFRRRDLPEELYRILWDKLSLKSARFGRSGVLYKGLRELVVARIPGIEAEVEENFLQLNKAHDAYRLHIRQHPEDAEQENAAFFAREDFQRALQNRRFAEEQLLHYGYWLSADCDRGFLMRLLAFYRTYPDAPCAEQAVERVWQIFREQEIQCQNEEDRSAPAGAPGFSFRPFFRHWLNTGFYTAQHPESGRPLSDYLNESLPYLPEWSGRFLAGPDGAPVPRSLTTVIGGIQVEILYHMRYIEYRGDGFNIYDQCLPWELLAAEGGEYFFHLLPLAAAYYNQLEEVYVELLRRLRDTAAPSADQEFFAACLAQYVCCLPVPENQEEGIPDILPMRIFAEDAERLFGAAWYRREGVLILYEQTFSGQRELPRGQIDQLYDEEEAVALAQRLLSEALSPSGFDLSLLKELPEAVYAQPHYAAECVYKRRTKHELSPEVMALKELLELGDKEDPESQKEVRKLLEAEGALEDEDDEELEEGVEELTQEVLAKLLEEFAENKLRRLELTWGWYGGSLVFLSDRNGYACLFFEHSQDVWYSLLSLPEVYRTVEHTDVEYVPFGMGKLPSYSVHRDPASILRNLDLIFSRIGRGRPETRVGDRWLWSSNVELHNAHHKMLMAQQKLGGFPPERGRNYILTKFVFSRYPSQMESLTADGERSLTDIKSGSYGLASSGLIQFMQGKLARLRLSWRFETAEEGAFLRHIVLLQDSGRFMMAWLTDDSRQADFYVADVQAYMDVEGKKYPKDTFLGRTMPAYLIHPDLKRIRNCLDLMLDDIADPSPVVGQFAHFAWETPVKRRSYEEIRRDLVKDDPS